MTDSFTAEIEINGSKDSVFEAITDYRAINSYTDAARIAGRGSGVGTRIYFRLAKDVLSIPTKYTVKIELTEYDSPDYIEWEMVEDIDAYGNIKVTELSDDKSRLSINFNVNIENSNIGALPAPKSANAEQIIEYIYPKVDEQTSGIVDGIVEDIEGDSRDVRIEFKNVSEVFSSFV